MKRKRFSVEQIVAVRAETPLLCASFNGYPN